MKFPWLVPLAFLIFSAALFPRASQSPFYHNDYLTLYQASLAAEDPREAWAPDSDARRHPLYFLFLFAEFRLLGNSAVTYHAVNFIFHFANVLLLILLCRKLRMSREASVLAGLFFLFTSSHFQAIVIPSGRIQTLTLLLASLICWLSFLEKGNPGNFLASLIFASLSILTGEEGVLAGALAFFFTLLFPPADLKIKQKAWIYLLIFLGATGALLYLELADFAGFQGRQQWIQPDFLTPAFLLRKLISLGRMLAAVPLFPQKPALAFLPPAVLWLRFLPLAAIPVLVFTFLKKEGRFRHFISHLSKKHTTIAWAWTLLAALPYLPNQLPFEDASRYIYFPAAGFSLWAGNFLAGIICTAMRPGKKESVLIALVLIYAVSLNLLLTHYYFRRYQDHVRETPAADYTDEVKELFGKSQEIRL